MSEVLLLWQVGLIANVKLHFLLFAHAYYAYCLQIAIWHYSGVHYSGSFK